MNKGTIQIYGRNMVKDGLMSEARVSGVMITNQVRNEVKIKEIIQLCETRKIQVTFAASEVVEKMTGTTTHQGILANIELPEASLTDILTKKNPLILLLHHIDYEQNLGAIMRTAWASNVDLIVASPNGVCEVTSVVAKVSNGGAVYVPLVAMSLFNAIALIKKAGFPVVGVEVDKGEVYTKADLTGGLAVLMGGEAVGLSEPLIKDCDRLVHIPMAGGIASLNVSVATALILFERMRQRRGVSGLNCTVGVIGRRVDGVEF